MINFFYMKALGDVVPDRRDVGDEEDVRNDGSQEMEERLDTLQSVLVQNTDSFIDEKEIGQGHLSVLREHDLQRQIAHEGLHPPHHRGMMKMIMTAIIIAFYR